MSAIDDEFIQIDRTFHELSLEEGAGDEAQMFRLLGNRDVIHWADLLSEHRVILLSEAGSGKTAEIRNVTRKLREEGKPAFFVRIEHVSQDFESAFEEGTHEEFMTWARSGQEGWLLLDSVDEARLRDPSDFERAIKRLGRHLKAVLQQAHILITSRATAWRSKTDLHLCRTEFPFQPILSVVSEDAEDPNQQAKTKKESSSKPGPTVPFKVVAIDNIQGEQFDAFVKGKGVEDINALRGALERKDAWPLTTRPLDLTELIEFWFANGRIGSRLELMESSIERRLEERDQNRADARPIAKEKLLFGVKLIAAAATLCQESAIRVPDGAENNKGFSVKDVLVDWDDKDCMTLLGRPIFDEGIYGSVRFHHRSVREYLAATWLHSLLKDHASRTQIEGLIFKSQYGMEVIVPTMRPVLPWLVLMDGRILERACKIAPEILFEGGDPSKLPPEKRSEILRQVCEQLAQPAHGRSMMDYSAVQRFANADLADDVKTLLEQYGEDDNIASFLARMVWHGELTTAAPEMKKLALQGQRSKHVRQSAIRALTAVGTVKDLEEVRRELVGQGAEIPREFISELVPKLAINTTAVEWLLLALEQVEAEERYHVDTLPNVLSQVASTWPLVLLPRWVNGLKRLLSMPPVIERRYCEISQRYKWLARHAAEAILRLADAKDPAALEEPSLHILRSIGILDEYHKVDIAQTLSALKKSISEWPELNRKLFWHEVAQTRAGHEANSGKPVTEYWQVGFLGRIWDLDVNAFDVAIEDITSRALEDDRLVALTLAFALYLKSDRPTAWRRKLTQAAKHEASLKAALGKLLRPSRDAADEWSKEEAKWKRQYKKRQAKEEERKQQWLVSLRANYHKFLVPENPKTLTNAQMYLYNALREGRGHSGKLGNGDWRSLIPEFGEGVANAFRDGAIRYWRNSRPKLNSQGKEENAIYPSTMFGLEGLEIEAQEVADWEKKLSKAEVKIAAGLAMLELNGFPSWLPGLYAAHPEIVIDTVMREIDFELANDDPKKDRHYVIDDVAYSGQWIWDGIAPLIVKRLSRPTKNIRALRNLLTVVQGSSLPDSELATLAAQKARTVRNGEAAPQWFATWAGVDPDRAIPALAARIAEFKLEKHRTAFAMNFIVALIGDRRDSSSVRQAYRTVAHMKALMLLTHEYVRQQEDIERAGKGAYSPGLRDDAQDARNALFAFVREARGKEAFLALSEIAQSHPNEASRPWMGHYAKEKAIQDADIAPWPPGRVREFHDNAERTPGTHRDLWELASNRLLDLKHDVEDGDASIASMLLRVDDETELRNYIGGWCRDRAAGRYLITQEEELADAKRPDLRFNVIGIDAPVPVELKIADKWTGPRLHERLEEQLCGDYLRDVRSDRGIFALIFRGERVGWDLPGGGRADTFEGLVNALQNHWTSISGRYPGVDDVKVIGIDLIKRGARRATRSMRKEPLPNAMPVSKVAVKKVRGTAGQ